MHVHKQLRGGCEWMATGWSVRVKEKRRGSERERERKRKGGRERARGSHTRIFYSLASWIRQKNNNGRRECKVKKKFVKTKKKNNNDNNRRHKFQYVCDDGVRKLTSWTLYMLVMTAVLYNFLGIDVDCYVCFSCCCCCCVSPAVSLILPISFGP